MALLSTAQLRFGPGQMRAFARTTRPIGGIRALTPVLLRDYTRATDPLRVQLGATLIDSQGGVLAGAAPLHIKVIDSSGAVRYDLYRATTNGTWRDELPLAANDPVGKWTVVAQELLSGTQSSMDFLLPEVVQCGAVAGTAQRALTFGDDRERIYRFFRTHRSVTIVKGNNPLYADAAKRLVEILAPWDVQCTVVDATEVDKTPELSEAQAKTWIGLDYAPSGAIKAGANPPQVAGYVLTRSRNLAGYSGR